MKDHKHRNEDDSKNCERCRRKRRGLTHIGPSPKCGEHRMKEKKRYYS